MSTRCCTAWLLSLLAWGAVLPDGRYLPAEEFRLENKVFLDGDETADVESTTIFLDGVVYDFLKQPPEVIIFDKSQGRFVLLDLQRRLKTEVTTNQVMAFTEWIKQWSAGHDDGLLRFMANPDLASEQQQEQWVFRSSWLVYRVKPQQPADTRVAPQFRNFSAWYSRLNTMLNPGARPPFARIIVDEALAAQGLIPSEVELSIRDGKGWWPKWTTIRSQHQLVPYLVESDRDRIRQADQFLSMFLPVKFYEYQRNLRR